MIRWLWIVRTYGYFWGVNKWKCIRGDNDSNLWDRRGWLRERVPFTQAHRQHVGECNSKRKSRACYSPLMCFHRTVSTLLPSSCSSNEGSQLDPLGRGNSAVESLCACICGTMLSEWDLGAIDNPTGYSALPKVLWLFEHVLPVGFQGMAVPVVSVQE